MEGTQEVFIRNIDLPRSDAAKKKNKKVMEAIKDLKRDKVGVENVYTKMRRIFSHYEKEGEQQRRQRHDCSAGRERAARGRRRSGSERGYRRHGDPGRQRKP